MNNLLTIQNDVIIIDKLSIISHLDLPPSINSNFITTDTIQVSNINLQNTINWSSSSEDSLLNTGLSWNTDSTSVKLCYRNNGRLWSNGNIDLDKSSMYMIDNIPVLNSISLGQSVIKSNLRQVGPLMSLMVTGNTSLKTVSATDINASNLRVSNITVDTLNVKELFVEGTTLSSEKSDILTFAPDNWVTDTEDQLNGLGLKWKSSNNELQLIYRTKNRLWTNGNIDIPLETAYMIDSVPVLSGNTLGNSITNSNLKQVGRLKNLTVNGDASISEFAYFNSSLYRLGLGTSDPFASISILDNDVAIAIGSPDFGIASFGAYSNHDLTLTTDNLPRITIKNTGEVHISDEVSRSGVLRVFGSLYVDNLVSDTRIERSEPLEFRANSGGNIYGKGLTWSGTGVTRKLIMLSGPDRLWSSESIDIDSSSSYLINRVPVLSSTSLGKSIVNSNLTSVGKLSSLEVEGNTTLSSVNANSVNVTDLTVTGNIITTTDISLSVNNRSVFYSNDAEIRIGNASQNQKLVKVFGSLSVGINNPDPSVSLSVSGNISFNNKKFITGATPPISGIYIKGDICWNDNPTEYGVVGWICILSGTPGEWRSFGDIGAK